MKSIPYGSYRLMIKQIVTEELEPCFIVDQVGSYFYIDGNGEQIHVYDTLNNNRCAFPTEQDAEEAMALFLLKGPTHDPA